MLFSGGQIQGGGSGGEEREKRSKVGVAIKKPFCTSIGFTFMIHPLRFDPLCGEFNDKLFKESYQFVNEVKSKELVELKKQLKTEEDNERREEVILILQCSVTISSYCHLPGEVPDPKNGESAESRSSEPGETSSS